MDIKEIAQKLFPGYWKRDQWNIEYFDSVGFSEALIESYKAELLKEAGESIYQVCKSDSISLSSAWIDVTEQTYNDAGLYPEYGRRILYTSDQLAAAIIKATKPLEERRCEICGYAEHHREHTGCLRTQLTTAREEIDQLRQRVQELEKQRDELLAALERCRFALEPYDDIKPRDWKSDRLNLRDAHQVAVAAIASVKGEQ